MKYANLRYTISYHFKYLNRNQIFSILHQNRVFMNAECFQLSCYNQIIDILNPYHSLYQIHII